MPGYRRLVRLFLLVVTWSYLSFSQLIDANIGLQEEQDFAQIIPVFVPPFRRTRGPILVTERPSKESDLLDKFPGLFRTQNEVIDHRESGRLDTSTSYHGCCASEPKLETFTTLSDPLGTAVSLVQVGQRSQYFPTETCRKELNCLTCQCSCTMVNQTLTALVFKPGSTREIMFSFVQVPTFCRCMNNLT
nr:hypothetical protein BgiMline_023625 [Biomphalaria glabrata]